MSCGVGVAAAAALALSAAASGAVPSRVDPAPPGLSHAQVPKPTAGSPWLALKHTPPFAPGAMLLLTDGRVLVQSQGADNGGSNQWWTLTPSSSGSYADGTWKQEASMQSRYAPQYFASAVLPDGRVIIEGGEYNHDKLVETNLGAVYSPTANKWTMVAPPNGGKGQWSRIGDAPSTMLANGRFMLGASGYSGTTAQAILNARTMKWTATGRGKADGNGEEGWTLLPNGKVLTVDTSDLSGDTELYNPVSGSWTSAGHTPTELIDGDGEVGPQLLMPDGKVLATGATGANDLYNTATGKWSAGPAFPVINGKRYDIADGPGAVLPDGQVLLDASPGDYTPPAHFFVYNGSKLVQIPDAPDAASQASNYGFMLVLPTGQVLFNDRIGQIDLYNEGRTPNSAWRPSVTSVPSTVARGKTYTVEGKQLSGVGQDAAYGDDYQDLTNYPLVRITNSKTHRVVYARTSAISSMSVAPGTKSSAKFTVPSGTGTGSSTLVIVANGIASAPVKIKVS